MVVSPDLKSATLHDLQAALQQGSVQATGLTASALAYAVAQLHRSTGRPVVVVSPSGESAAAFEADLRFFFAR